MGGRKEAGLALETGWRMTASRLCPTASSRGRRGLSRGAHTLALESESGRGALVDTHAPAVTDGCVPSAGKQASELAVPGPLPPWEKLNTPHRV